jgi:TonB family protein
VSRVLGALAVSASLHGLLAWEVARPACHAASTEEVEVEIRPERMRLSSAEGRAAASMAPSRSKPVKRPASRAAILPAKAPSSFESVTAVPPAASAAAVAPASEPEAAGSVAGEARAPAQAGLDLGAFVERLRRSAQRCAPRRLAPGAEVSLARVRFCVDPSGQPEAVTLLQSTGDAQLDRAAVECVIPGAAPLPASDSCLVVPLRFSL